MHWLMRFLEDEMFRFSLKAIIAPLLWREIICLFPIGIELDNFADLLLIHIMKHAT